MESELQWSHIKEHPKIQGLYTDDGFPWVLRDSLADTLLEASLDETKVADKQKVMQSLQQLCTERNPELEEVFTTYINQFEKKSQPYTLLKKLVTAERRIIRSLQTIQDEPSAVEVKEEPEEMEVDNPIYEILEQIKGNVLHLPQ
jgi:hypothetical protein